MNDAEVYMEAYFKRALSDAEMKQFEERCIHDAAFAKQVALYISTEEGIRQQLLDEKKQQWRAISKGEANGTATPVKKMNIRKWMVYAAAACVLVAVALVFIFRQPSPHQLEDKYIAQHVTGSPHQLAEEYIAQHFTYLSQTMNANVSVDILQQGIAAYNNKDYSTALQLFQKVYSSNPANSKAKKYIGIVYLTTKQYEQALQQFEELANTPGLHDNSGLFLMAVTLLERDKQGDKVQAKWLLRQVVQQGATGSKEAAEWLKVWE